MSQKTYKVLLILSSVLVITFSLTSAAFILVICVTNFLVKIGYIANNQITLYVICFLIYVLMIFIQIMLFVYYGYRVMKTVRERSLNIKQEQSRGVFVQTIQKPITKVVVLVLSLIGTTFIQVLAAVSAVLTSSYFGDANVIGYFLNSFGVLLFAICIILLYNPLFSQRYDEMETTLDHRKSPKEIRVQDVKVTIEEKDTQSSTV